MLMLTLIPLGGLAIGLYATRVFGRGLPLAMWLSVVGLIVGTHTWFWRDVYFPGQFGGIEKAAMPLSDFVLRILSGPTLLGAVTLLFIGLGLITGPLLRDLRTPRKPAFTNRRKSQHPIAG